MGREKRTDREKERGKKKKKKKRTCSLVPPPNTQHPTPNPPSSNRTFVATQLIGKSSGGKLDFFVVEKKN